MASSPPFVLIIPKWENFQHTLTPTVSATGAVDGFLSAEDIHQQINAGMQSAAALASFKAGKNPENLYLAAVAAVTNVQAMGSGIAVLIDDKNRGQSNSWTDNDIRRVISDAGQILGNATSIIGIFTLIFGKPKWATIMEWSGAGLTLSSMAMSPDSVVANAAKVTINNAINSWDQVLNSSVNDTESDVNSVSSWISSENNEVVAAWNSAKSALSSAINSIKGILESVENSSTPGLSANSDSAAANLSNIKDSIATMINSAGLVLPAVTATFNNNSIEITSSDSSFNPINGNINYNSANNSIGFSTSEFSESYSIINGNVVGTTIGLASDGSIQYTKTTTTYSDGHYTSHITANGGAVDVSDSPVDIMVDSTGNVIIDLPPEAGSGLSRSIIIAPDGTTVSIGGNPRLSLGAGNSTSVDSNGHISVTTTPVIGFSQTTTLNQNGTTTQSFSAHDSSGNPISLSQIYAPLVAPVLSQVQLGSSTFSAGGAQTFQNFLNTTVSNQAVNLASSIQTQTQAAFSNIQGYIINGTLIPPSSLVGILPYSIQSVINPLANVYSQSMGFSDSLLSYAAGYISPPSTYTQTTKQPNVDVQAIYAGGWDRNGTFHPAGGSFDNPNKGAGDPLVLSTTRKGINLLSLSQSAVQFDYIGNGVKQSTGWVGENTGFLILTTNGSTDIKTGNLLTFTSLTALDSNHDGKISSTDIVFANLRVWEDENTDGVSQATELLTLSQLGIQSINTASTAITETVGGNIITDIGSLTFTDGTTESIDNVILATITQQGTLPLHGQSASALTFMQKVLGGLPAKAEGMASADIDALEDVMKSLAVADSNLAADTLTNKGSFGTNQMLDPMLINMTTGYIANSIFQANDSNGKSQIWSTDGTAAGTFQITNIAGGIHSQSKFGVMGTTGKQLFTAIIGGVAASEQLWVTDGTVAGTKQLTNVANTTGLKLAYLTGNSFLTLGTSGLELFIGNDANNAKQLWVTDGTAVGTKQLTSISGGLNPANFVSLANGQEMFSGRATDGTTQVWVTDGTTAGTHQVTSVGGTGLNPTAITVLGTTGTELFSGTAANGSKQLFVTDGTGAGTTQISNIGGTNNLLADFQTLGTTDKELFKASAGSISQLWVTDGTATGTVQLTNISGTSGLNPSGYLSLGDKKELFQGIGSNGKNQLWGTDGTVAGTQQLTTIAFNGLNPTNFITLTDSKELFLGIGSNGKNQVWSTDGTTAGTIQLTNNTATNTMTNFTGVGTSGKELYTNSGILYVTDGTSAGTIQLSPITITWLEKLGNTGKVLFSGYSGGPTGIRQLWVTDGTASGTIQLTNTVGKGHGAYPLAPQALGKNKELFVGGDENGITQAWVTDGTVAGTQKITNFSSDFILGDHIAFGSGGKIILNASLGAASVNEQIWVTDGTSSGTVQLTHLGSNQGIQVDSYAGFIPMGNTGKVLFEASIDGGSLHLWASDGTAAGTVDLGDMGGFVVPTISPLGTTGKYVVQGFNGSSFRTWITDGTASGTQLWTGVYGSSANTFIIPTMSIAAPAIIRDAGNVVNLALQSTDAAAQYVKLAAGYHIKSDIAAVTANTENALIGSDDDTAAWNAASLTEVAWHNAFTNMALVPSTLQSATNSLMQAKTVVDTMVTAVGNGGQFLTQYDAKEASDAAEEHAVSAQALAVAQAVYQSLLVAAAQSWNATQAKIVMNGENFTAVGGDLIIAAAGTETLSDGASPSTYAVLQGANIQITNFHAGLKGSRIEFLSSAENAVFTQLSNGTQITAGTSTVLLVGVNMSSLSFHDNFAGVQDAIINGTGAIANMDSGEDFIDDGTTHINSLIFGTGTSQTLIGSDGYQIYNFALGDGINTIINGVPTNNGPTGEINFGLGITGSSLIFNKSADNLVININGTADQLTIQDWFANSYSQVYSINTADGRHLISGVSGSIIENNTIAGTSRVQMFAPSGAISTEFFNYFGLDGIGTLKDTVINWSAGGSQTQVFYGLQAGLSKVITNYSGANATGIITSTSIFGTSGNDTIMGGTYKDTIDGGSGNDTLTGGANSDIFVVNKSSVANTIITDFSTSTPGEYISLIGFTSPVDFAHLAITQSGNNAIITLENGQTITLQNVTASSLTAANFGGDAITGTSGNDVLNGTTGADNIYGLGGDDVINGSAGSDNIDGGDGFDTISYASSGALVSVNLVTNSNNGDDAASDILINIEKVIGSDYADTITAASTGSTLDGRSGNDTLNGGAGDDTLIGGAGNDYMDGGPGSDTVSYANSSAVIMVNLNNVGQDWGAYGDSLYNIENIIGSSFGDTITAKSSGSVIYGGDGWDIINGGVGNDTIYGENGNDTVYAGDGNDTIYGGAGNDAIYSNGGNNILIGGEGADTLNGFGGTATGNYSASASAVSINLTTNVNTGGDAQGDGLYGVSNIIGTNFDDTIIGDGFSNKLYGGAGNDLLAGIGYGGNTLDGGDGNDTVSYASASSVYVDLNVTASQGWGASGDIVLNVENLIGSSYDDNLSAKTSGSSLSGGDGWDIVSGAAGNDILHGDGGNDTLYGNGGDDIIYGDAGDDSIYGGTGTNILIGGAGADSMNGFTGIATASYATSSAAISINLNNNANTGGDAQGDTLYGIANIIGSGFNDTIVGNYMNNTIIGGSGVDSMSGGTGADIFKYSSITDSGSASGARDIITDFAEGTDKIDLGDFAGEFTFKGTSAFTGTAHEVNYAQVSGNTIIGVDADGNGALDFQIELAGLHTLTANDFLL